MKAYKGFTKDLKCRNFQFEEGIIYEENEAKLCEKGFHACEDPIDCFSYYSPSDSVYHAVELEDVSDEKEVDSKRVGKKIKIGARLSVANICELHFKYIKEKSDNVKDNTGYRSAASNTGDYSAASNTGYRSAASNTGDYSAASVSGKGSVAIVTGCRSRAKANIGSAIVICERDDNYNLINIKAEIVDGAEIKADTWYTLENGVFVEEKE